MSKLLGKMLYVDVILRTSWFPACLGALIAFYAGVAQEEWQSIVCLFLGVVGILLGQGVVQHGHDQLTDKGGMSSFRTEITDAEAKKVKVMIYAAIVVLVIIAIACLGLGRVWLPLLVAMGVRSAFLYNRTHNEWYSVFGFMVSASVGYFALTNYFTLGWLILILIIGFIMKTSQAMYRLDDYLGGEIPCHKQIIMYYRNVFRNTIHIVPPLIIALLLYLHSGVGGLVLDMNVYVVGAIYALMMGGFAVQIALMKKAQGELVNMEPIVGGIIVVEILAMAHAGAMRDWSVAVPYGCAVILTAWAFYRFWNSRHSTCNNVKCPRHELVKEK